MRSVLYLHGFASSPNGRKATAVRDLLAAHDLALNAPDLNAPSFAQLDFNVTVEVALHAAARQAPAVIVGSSLGGLIALECVRRGLRAPLVLIAPAIGISDLWLSRLPAGDPIVVYHYAQDCETAVHRLFFEAMARVDADAEAPVVPVSVIMGRNDESVPFARVAAVWKRWEPGLVEPSRFIEIPDGDHGLTGFVPRIVEEILERAGEPPLCGSTVMTDPSGQLAPN